MSLLAKDCCNPTKNFFTNQNYQSLLKTAVKGVSKPGSIDGEPLNCDPSYLNTHSTHHHMFDKNLQMFVIVVEKDKSLPNTFTLNDLLKTFCGTAVSRKKRRKILIFKVANSSFLVKFSRHQLTMATVADSLSSWIPWTRKIIINKHLFCICV